jgi:hypothetical protein
MNTFPTLGFTLTVVSFQNISEKEYNFSGPMRETEQAAIVKLFDVFS